jgi:hypothetical protein
MSTTLRFLLLGLLLIGSGCATTSVPLIQASLDGDMRQVKKLIAEGVPVNVQNCHVGFDYVCCAPITCASNRKHLHVVKYLVDHGADVNTIDDSGHFPGSTGWTALHYAAYRGSHELTHYLLNKGADSSITNSSGYTAYNLANTDEVKTLLASDFRKQYAADDPKPAQPSITAPSPAVSRTPATLSDITTAIPSGKPAGRYDVAVVIGNSSYSATGTPNVDYALLDAQTMRQYLIKAFGYDPANIIYLENATLTKLNEIFGTESDYRGKLYKWVKPGQSKLFVYYVGHGAPDQQSGEGYFVPVDANPQYINTSGYKLSTFYENLSRIPAIKKTVVIDACFSGSSSNGQLLKGVSGLTARLKAEPKASAAADLLLTSAGMDQVASWYPEKGHSLFTYFFLKGIQGGADTNKDGNITMGEMKAWLNDQVPYMARRLTGNEQQPVMMGRDGETLTTLTR